MSKPTHTWIPRKTQVAGMNILVYQADDFAERTGMVGTIDYRYQKIIVDPGVVSLQATEQSYFHELVHMLFNVLGYDKLRDNEVLVESFSQLLYQALDNADYNFDQHPPLEDEDYNCASPVPRKE